MRIMNVVEANNDLPEILSDRSLLAFLLGLSMLACCFELSNVSYLAGTWLRKPLISSAAFASYRLYE